MKGYASNSAVPLIVLTDVKTWIFYYKGKLAFETDFSLQKQNVGKASKDLKKFLEPDRVYKGDAYRSAEGALDEKKNLAEARKRIPAVWREIVKESNPLRKRLINELRKRAGHALGVQALLEADIVAFLQSLESRNKSKNTRKPRPKSERERTLTPSSVSPGRKIEESQRPRAGELVIHEESFHYKNPTDAMVTVFKELERREPGFWQRFYNDPQNRNRSNTRRIIAQDVRGLYNSDNPRYKKAYKQLGGGWIIATYNSKQTIEKSIKRAADVARLKFGKDIIVNFNNSLQRQERQVPAPPSSEASGSSSRGGELVILGKSFPRKNPTDAMVIVFKELERREPGFCQRFYNNPRNHGRTRRIIAQDARKLYDHAHLAKYHERIDSNWVISTNYNKQTIEKIIRIAVDVAGLEFGRDVINQSQERQVSTPPPPRDKGSKGKKRKGGRSEMLVIRGESFPYKDFTDAMVTVFKELERREPGFYQRFYNDPKNYRGRSRIIAQDAKELYGSDNPRYEKAYKRLGGGWVIRTYNNKKTIEDNIRRAAEVAGLEFGRDIIINFDD